MELKKTWSCGAVVWRTTEVGTKEILLIKQFEHKDAWGIPKGHMDEGESYEQCAVREVREETGIRIELGTKLVEVETIWKNEQKTVVSYLARQLGDDALSTDDPDCEVADVRWFPIDKLPWIHQYQRPLITYAIEQLKVM